MIDSSQTYAVFEPGPDNSQWPTEWQAICDTLAVIADKPMQTTAQLRFNEY